MGFHYIGVMDGVLGHVAELSFQPLSFREIGLLVSLW